MGRPLQFFAAVFCLGANPLLGIPEQSVTRSLSAGGEQTCAIDGDEVVCWGPPKSGSGIQTTVRTLHHPTRVSVGEGYVCALDADGVKCWGRNEQGQLDVPKLDHPTDIATAWGHVCAVHAGGVKCWGKNLYGQLNVPPLHHPTQVSAGSFHSCALDADGVKCWRGDDVLTAVPSLNHPIQVTSGTYHNCAIDTSGVRCWGRSRSERLGIIEGELSVPPLREPRQVVAGNDFTCALDADGVKCWGSTPYGVTKVPPLGWPRQIAAGTDHACALDGSEVICWGGYAAAGQNTYLQNVRFSLSSVELTLRHLAKFLYAEKRAFFEGLAAALEADGLTKSEPMTLQYRKYAARYFALDLIGPVIENSGSRYLQEKVLPTYRRFLTDRARVIGVSSLGEIDPTASLLSLCLTASHLALRACRPFVVDPAMRATLENLLEEIGRLDAEGKFQRFPRRAAERLGAILALHPELFQALLREPRTRGFGAMLGKLAEYLRGIHG